METLICLTLTNLSKTKQGCVARNLQQHAKRLIAHSSRPRFFCTYRNGTLSSSATNQTLQSRIEAALDQKAAITTVLEQWRQQQGNQLNPLLVRGVYEKLHESKRYSQALEVSNWMVNNKICNHLPEDLAVRFHLIENVLGLEESEKFFNSIPENLKGESIYTALLKSYAKSGEKSLSKAESTFEKMRKLGMLLRPSPYNSMVSLYSSLRNRVKVDEILREMKENNTEIDSPTVNNTLRVYAAVSDVATMDKFLADWNETTTLEWLTTLDMAKAYLRDGSKGKARDMLRKTEELNDPKSYEGLMRLYGEAGEIEDVYRIWDLYKKTRNKNNEGFRALIGSLLKLDDYKGAEEIYYNEWECSGLEFDLRVPSTLISGYRAKGMVKKADNLLYKTMKNKRLVKPINPLIEDWLKNKNQVKPSNLRDLIKNLCDSNQLSKALEVSSLLCDRKSFNIFPEDYVTRFHLCEKVLGLEEGEKFFERSIPGNMKDYSVYNTLLTSYTRSDKGLEKAEGVFEKMKELGFLSKLSPYNSMISLYIQLGKQGRAKNLLLVMKEKNIEHDSVTTNNVLRMYADEGDIETMEKYRREWVNDDEQTKLEMRTTGEMAKAYERAGLLLKAMEITSKREVQRIWNEYKKKAKEEFERDTLRPWVKRDEIKNEEYRNVIRTLLKLGDVQGAEAIYEEWEPQGPEFDNGIPCLLISRYYEEDDKDKAKEVEYSSRQKRRRMQFKLFKEDLIGCAVGVVVSVLLFSVPPIVLSLCLQNPVYFFVLAIVLLALSGY
ncbi:PREDICTED: putative pentatricopeptide repeat-containing protein At1g28020 [Camelina sativa]|uniref:Pentatricopeptide repeat-containing protein At1g28020 n=1 Tax=Camelina sativa TaxID=90675 RepID=A0ABM1QZJ5_CAMSA|nr:PREDICTED: putative pentatricopeptide repeat-containing protein At1g28020 [Camelina sativa]